MFIFVRISICLSVYVIQSLPLPLSHFRGWSTRGLSPIRTPNPNQGPHPNPTRVTLILSNPRPDRNSSPNPDS